MPHYSAAVAHLTDWSSAVRARRRLGHTIEVHETIDSTNDRARELLIESGVDGGVVIAEEQSAGRGRRGRSWLSPPGVNLMLSVALQPTVRARDAWQLGLATALATRAACVASVEGSALGLKWPNDLVTSEGRKVAGLLLETEVTGEHISAAVLGIGINVNWRRGDMPPDIATDATSLAELAGAEVDRVALLDRLLDALDDEVTHIEQGRSPLRRYRAACVTIGQEVTVHAAGDTIVGRAVDIDDVGSLVVETATSRVALATGEVAFVRTGLQE